jgi:hypothetical protein
MTKYCGMIAITFSMINILIVPFILLTHTIYLKSTKGVSERDTILLNLPILKNTSIAIIDHKHQVELDMTTTNDKNIEGRTKNNFDRYHAPKQGSAKTPFQLSQDRRQTMEKLKNVLGLNETVELLNFLYQSTTSPIQTSSSIDLPGWSQIEERYGPTFPRILGLEQCEQYRNTLVPDPHDRWVAPAGLFHSGTNLMAKLLAKTCTGGNLQPRGQVPYGKHNPFQAATIDGYRIPKAEYQQVKNISQVLPIVMVRHPLDWLQSLCQQPFTVSWKKVSSKAPQSSTLPCPSLNSPIQVKLYKDFHYANVLDFWSEWYFGYWNHTESARLIVRLEDLVFAPKETLQQICSCVGGKFRYESRILQERQGGTARQQQKQHLKEGEHFLVRAWRRHAGVTADRTFSSSPENRQIFRELEASPSMRDLLRDLNYNSIDGSRTANGS